MGIKLLNLETSGHAVSALKINYDNSDNFFWTSATLSVESSYVFSVKNYEFVNKNKKRYNFETA